MGVALKPDLLINKVKPDSVSGNQLIKIGWRIIKLEGEEVSTKKELLEKIAEIKKKEEDYTITFKPPEQSGGGKKKKRRHRKKSTKKKTPRSKRNNRTSKNKKKHKKKSKNIRKVLRELYG